MKPKFLLPILLTFLVSAESFAQDGTPKNKRMEWFRNAKLGIFIHWGVYAVNGNGASWQIKRGKISWDDYMKQAEKFSAENYNPENWAKLFKEAGARYVVLTSKHHDGFALWDTKYSLLDAKDFAAAGRDLLAPYAKAVRENGMKVGFYFSLLDWSHKDYEVDFSRPEHVAEFYPQPAWQKKLTKRERFVKFVKGQLRELAENYKPDLLWFDGGWERSSQWWDAEAIKDSLLAWNKEVIETTDCPVTEITLRRNRARRFCVPTASGNFA